VTAAGREEGQKCNNKGFVQELEDDPFTGSARTFRTPTSLARCSDCAVAMFIKLMQAINSNKYTEGHEHFNRRYSSTA